MKYFLIALALSGCGPVWPDVACAGPHPISCECVTSCSFGDVNADLELDAQQVLAGCMPRCWRRDQ